MNDKQVAVRKLWQKRVVVHGSSGFFSYAFVPVWWPAKLARRRVKEATDPNLTTAYFRRSA